MFFFKKRAYHLFRARVSREKKKDIHKRIEYPTQQVYSHHNISKNCFFKRKKRKKNEAKFSLLSPHHQTNERRRRKTIYMLIKDRRTSASTRETDQWKLS